MPPNAPPRPRRQEQIAEALRQQILCGKLLPGQRLPIRMALKKRFDASITTIQGALDRLVHDGFVVTRGTLGTFVVDHPPHIHQFALVLFARLGRCVRFLTLLANEAAAIGGGPASRIHIFHDVNSAPDNEPLRQLVAAARAQRLAGLILVGEPQKLAGTPLMDTPELPKVVIAPLPVPGWDTISLDEDNFLVKALAHFRSKGRKRLAVIAGCAQFLPPEPLFAAASTHGLCLHPYWLQYPYWLQGLPPNVHRGVRGCAHLLFHPGQDERPDALLISDDNLVEPALLGLMDAGLRIPQDLEIVCHCNFPAPGPIPMPITRLGYDLRLALTKAMAALDRLRRGQAPCDLLVPAEFETEVAARLGAPTAG